MSIVNDLRKMSHPSMPASEKLTTMKAAKRIEELENELHFIKEGLCNECKEFLG